ncbi:chlorophyll A-B-binding protein [Leptothoe sp. PORK10 BA2]|uniref:chlorophyll A-B-binding protein n=1 Tax=Leptothoe sp. PORK10 BA2 TaxID=3110254 RepID=UPI002B203588|nr:chlorophyll A-B-binding protein [Leptothoe sp. PORK10 BA2]MEA5464830.1 chlorophyll A-B-binding protein [Leptothoe sp. PORK10 BA2]
MSFFNQITLEMQQFQIPTLGQPAMTLPEKEPLLPNFEIAWLWGFTPQEELWNGQLAMIGVVCSLTIELLYNQRFLCF